MGCPRLSVQCRRPQAGDVEQKKLGLCHKEGFKRCAHIVRRRTPRRSQSTAQRLFWLVDAEAVVVAVSADTSSTSLECSAKTKGLNSAAFVKRRVSTMGPEKARLPHIFCHICTSVAEHHGEDVKALTTTI